ncbi:MAG: lipid-A-disaccharide synthase, partial [Pseudomonadota bacterium]
MTAGSARRILLSAVEPSGDALGAALMRAILSQAPETTFVGCGGKEMAAVGMASAFPISPLSVMGPLAALRAAPYAMLKAAELGRLAAERHADAAVLIDSWSFSILAAGAIRKQAPSCRLIKYVAPQVWASRPARVKTCEQLFDGLLTLFPFEQDWFTD